MASTNVFGKPVTGGTRLERARKANEDPNADGKRDEAVKYVKKQKENFGSGVSTLSIFYNATGETLFYAEDDSKYGKIYDSYPARVQNGQWGAFLHIKNPVVASGSEAFVVYRGRFNDTDYCKQLIAWDVPWDQLTGYNHAYCEINDDNSEIDKNKVYKNMEAGGRQHSIMKSGIFLTSYIDEGSSPMYEAQFILADAARAAR
uniref:23 kDa jasmonate-induced protein-like n=1 Tax=Erigeron canadensis TaxID=72917 RepID=UPI001CB8D9C6|nr:23 kDa jasmonate-induced protein-like [Erigeron canadensis]